MPTKPSLTESNRYEMLLIAQLLQSFARGNAVCEHAFEPFAKFLKNIYEIAFNHGAAQDIVQGLPVIALREAMTEYAISVTRIHDSQVTEDGALIGDIDSAIEALENEPVMEKCAQLDDQDQKKPHRN